MHLGLSSKTRGVLAVIDDNAFTRSLTADALRLVGATELVCVRSAADAVEQFRSLAPGAIVCDMHLPDMDGITFTRRLREGRMAVHRATPVILTSGSKTTRDVENARLAGVDEFIARPFSPRTLGDHIRVTLSRKRPFIDVLGYIGPCRRRRTDLEYSGPLRRTSDAQRAAIIREAVSLELLGQISAARLANNTVNRPLRMRIDVIGSIARHLQALCSKLDDAPLEKTISSLIDYFENRPYRQHYDQQIVESHIDVMQSLILLRSEDAVREAVVEELLRRTSTRRGQVEFIGH